MKPILCLGILLLVVTPASADIYSWVDDSGTYNYTEDYSRVPKKFRKKVKQSGDFQRNILPQRSPLPVTPPAGKAEKAREPVVATGDEKELYGGKSRETWRKELDVREAELNGIERRMEQLKSQIVDAKGISKEQSTAYKKEYDSKRETYEKKYTSYSEFIESARKAGLTVEIKK